MVKKPLERRKKFFPFFIIFFTFSLSPYGKKQNHLLFPTFLSLEIKKPQRKTSHKKLFFILLFWILPLLVIGKITTYLFFQNFDLKCPNMPLRAQVSFFTNYLFSAVITRTHTPTHTHSVFPTHYAKKTR